MVNTCGKVNLGWFERVVGGEVNIQKKHATGVGRVIGAHNGCLPMKHILSHWTSRAVRRRVLSKIHQLFVNPPQRHVYSVLLLNGKVREPTRDKECMLDKHPELDIQHAQQNNNSLNHRVETQGNRSDNIVLKRGGHTMKETRME
mmetsp:Transcript_6702/g.9732  ORF Transcript_6702/g.9732 Transcript_6702/m.9732 type:complete len:145 (-) Transcript_6702:410-844(-)